jgi:uncharacterized protein YndB with AHSA1/START domain
VIVAERTIDAPRERVFEFLAHLPNHWRLHDALEEVDSIENTTARVRLRGPLRISRDARTEVLEAVAPERLRGRADLSGGTRARVGWDLEDAGAGTTRVRLTTEIEAAPLRDRLLLALGGRWWVRRIYADALANLERLVPR